MARPVAPDRRTRAEGRDRAMNHGPPAVEAHREQGGVLIFGGMTTPLRSNVRKSPVVASETSGPASECAVL